VRALITLSIGGLLLCQTAFAEEVYRWVDRTGGVYYSDAEPLDVESARVDISAPAEGPIAVIERAGPLPQTAPREIARPVPVAAAQPSATGLGPCAQARQQLTLLHADVPVFLGGDGRWHPAGEGYDAPRSWLADATRPNAIRAARDAVLEACSDPDAVAAEMQDRPQPGR